MQELLAALAFRREALGQFLLVATILGAFSMSGVVVLLGGHERARLRAWLFVLLSAASLAFIFSTLVSVIILPGMGHPEVFSTPGQVVSMMGLYRTAMWSLVGGALLLLGSLAGMGFMVSRRVGAITTGASVVTVGAFVLCAWKLAETMGGW